MKELINQNVYVKRFNFSHNKQASAFKKMKHLFLLKLFP